jgi:hypothetical protein
MLYYVYQEIGMWFCWILLVFGEYGVKMLSLPYMGNIDN